MTAERTPQTFEVTLDKLAYGGEALGRLPDGRAVFVPFALPGETVRLRLVEGKRGFARAELLEVLSPSPERIAPRCAHFGECGGCHYQHMPYEAQLAAKADILRDQLERIGGLEDPPVRATAPSPSPFYYRNQVQFHLDPQGHLGYHRPRSNRVLSIEECHLPEGPLNDLWPRLDFEPLPGLGRVGLRLGMGEEAMLVLEGSQPDPPEFEVDLPIAAVYLGPEQAAVLSDSYYLVMEVLGRAFRVSADAFFQVNTAVAEGIVEHLLARLPLGPAVTLLEVYCGVGLFSAFLAPRLGRLVAVESSPAACDDFVVNLDEFDNVELYEGPAEGVLPALELQPDVMLVDPPRAGLARPVLDAVLAFSPPTLAYVSCDPATLGRDAKRLERGGYRLLEATPFDMFPQTYHIESVSIWEKG